MSTRLQQGRDTLARLGYQTIGLKLPDVNRILKMELFQWDGKKWTEVKELLSHSVPVSKRLRIHVYVEYTNRKQSGFRLDLFQSGHIVFRARHEELATISRWAISLRNWLQQHPSVAIPKLTAMWEQFPSR